MPKQAEKSYEIGWSYVWATRGRELARINKESKRISRNVWDNAKYNKTCSNEISSHGILITVRGLIFYSHNYLKYHQ